jgi:hypothetical protein
MSFVRTIQIVINKYWEINFNSPVNFFDHEEKKGEGCKKVVLNPGNYMKPRL